ncbi:GCN5-like N-acetyltransferase [Actinoplanes sp. N902-109]|nr:GCN5-like N-acetyltransferase [Actinoplanes sp. N902-109]
MTSSEFDSVVDTAFADYLTARVAGGVIRQEDAAADIQQQRKQYLPDGVATEHMLLYIGEADGERIGWIWLALPGGANHPDTAWVYFVVVDDAHRGKGYGRGLMLAAERELVQRGVRRLGLNVFGANETAIRLYERLGYQVVTQQMTKPLIG